MRHGFPAFEHIQDDQGVIGDDEPVFLLRAKDLLAVETIRHWADLAEQAGAPGRAAAAREWAEEFTRWQAANATQYPADSG